MKCPHCDYEHGWSSEKSKRILGKKGEFYAMPVKMERTYIHYSSDVAYMYGCPNCMKVFIRDEQIILPNL